jgi:hypothetical protein
LKRNVHEVKQPSNANDRAGWSVKSWCETTGISDALLYKLDEARRPASVKIGRKRLITESPGDWLRRMAAAQ